MKRGPGPLEPIGLQAYPVRDLAGLLAPPITRRYDTRRADWTKFKEALKTELENRGLNRARVETLTTRGEVDGSVDELTEAVTAA